MSLQALLLVQAKEQPAFVTQRVPEHASDPLHAKEQSRPGAHIVLSSQSACAQSIAHVVPPVQVMPGP